jgi:hypothetical protein
MRAARARGTAMWSAPVSLSARMSVIGDALDSLSDNDRVSTAVLDLLNDVKVLPLADRETAVKLIERVYREVGFDGTKDAALTQAVSSQRKILKL